MSKKTGKIEYESLSPIEHIKKRSDMYIGTTRNLRQEVYISEKVEDQFKIYKKEIDYNPGLLRIFIEPLSNAIDNAWRSKEHDVKMTKIRINISDEGEVTIFNDGLSIAIEKNKDGLYNPDFIFGKLLTSSNYNDDEKRLTSGRNGLGVKLTNIFSTSFKIKIVDPHTEQQYVQEWSENMSVRKEPKITKSKTKSGSTEITFTPDFSRFGLKNFTPDLKGAILKHIIDSTIITDLNVFYNDDKIPMKNIGDYVKMYSDDPDLKFITINVDDSKVAIAPSTEFSAISFVNGVETREGGVHVDAWCEAIFRPLLDKFNTKKGPSINIRDIKNFFRIFVFCTVPNPEFSSQEKTKLNAPAPKTAVETKHINAIMKWDIAEKIKDLLRSKELNSLKKTEKKRGFTKIEGLDSANLAGGKHSSECSLILTEGLSAKTYAVKGIETGVYGKKGRDYNGIFPLRGKVLNTRNASIDSISKNREITDLIKALNLRHGVDYTDDKNFSTLNYGKVIILTDADTDGIHIAGLLINFFHSMFPSLLKRDESFVVSMKTPIIRIYIRNEQISFYTLEEFSKYQAKSKHIGKIKYYKGLGTSNDVEIKESFGKKMVEYVVDEKTDDNMNKVFHTKFSDARKQWLEEYDNEDALTFIDKGTVSTVCISDFINGEMIKFSIDDCKRSIPNVMDGLKESHRKILYAAFLKNLKFTGTTLKVAQLAGFVAEKTNYHHGEQCLFETITKMAHEFPGSNNIPLFFRDGQFGSRLAMGKDAASARYIFTKLDKLTRTIFREEDDPVLKYIVDDGDVVEPEFYVPIIPMILVNGVQGIGSGWSTNIPSYNPKDLVECIKIWIKNDKKGFMKQDDGSMISLLPEISPWFRGFKGDIEKVADNKYETRGLSRETDTGILIEELPIGMATDKFKDHIEDLIEEKKIKNYKNYSNSYKVNFEIEPGTEFEEDCLKLKTSVMTSNMVTFNSKNLLQKFTVVDEIIDYFCEVRLEYYVKRKAYILSKLKRELKILKNREKFLEEIINKKLVIFERDDEDITQDLEKRGYDKDDEGSYKYLLDQKIRSFTKKQLDSLREDIEKVKAEIKKLEATSEKQLWINELDQFLAEYQEWLDDITAFEDEQTVDKEKAAKKKKGKK